MSLVMRHELFLSSFFALIFGLKFSMRSIANHVASDTLTALNPDDIISFGGRVK